MRTTDIVLSANKNLWRNKLRSILTIVAIFIGAFTIILTTGINTGVSQYIDSQIQGVGGEDYMEIMPASTFELLGSDFLGSSDSVTEYNPEKSQDIKSITEEDIEKISEVKGILSVEAYHELSSEYITSKDADKKYTLKTQKFPSESITPELAAGRMVANDADQKQITLLPGHAEALGFESDKAAVGQRIKIGVKNQVTNKISEIDATVTGIQEKSVISGGSSWVNTSLADEIYNISTKNVPSTIKDKAFAATAQIYKESSDDNISDIQAALRELGYVGMTVEDSVGMIKTFFDAMTIVLTIFGVIALLAAVIGIINTLFMSVQERTREIGLMKAMGLAPSTIRTIFNIEAILLGFWGSVLGIVVAFIAAGIANDMAATTFLSGLPGFTLIVLDPGNLIIFVLLVMFVAFLAGSLPARRASKLDPIEALRYE